MPRLAYFFATFFLALLLFLAPSGKAQGTYTAASCNQSDVNAIINGPKHTAVNGDTIQIPAGSCTGWTGITVPSGIGISVVGGIGGTTTLTGDPFFRMSPIYGNSTSRISSMTFLPSGGNATPVIVDGTCTSSGCPNLRIDHITIPTSWSNVSGLSDGAIFFIANVFGVADQNTVGDTRPSSGYVCFLNIGHGSWQGVGAWGDNSWASADSFGTAQAFYLENNTFVFALATDSDIGDSTGGGARFVCRFNNFNPEHQFGACAGHGTDTTGRARGVRQWEGYDNTIVCSDTGCGGFPGRSGVGISFGNVISNNGGSFGGLAQLDAQRRWRVDSWGSCDGTSAWDTNDTNGGGGNTAHVYYSGTVGSVSNDGINYTVTISGASPGWTANQWAPAGNAYSFHDITGNFGFEIGSNAANTFTSHTSCLGSCGDAPTVGDSFQILRSTACLDQPAHSGGLLVRDSSGTNGIPVLVSTGSPGPVNQALDPTYEADDALPGGQLITSNNVSLIANRDWYQESVNQAAQTSNTSPFNGTSGTGHGTLANRPITCTPRVGYWATDQGSWNTSGSGGQGQLYVCTATNTWTLHYTPYTYPHPLIAGGTTGTIVNPPTNLRATVQ